ncbi:hypothetical protein CYY_008010 [Polysphondylium violaceum]|uniref:Methyltransferase type 11 domain-containing protein n=1 Tax=Polysphondylium violaceum TaxID=133409 RepID=A0A8J4UXA3_9MYCE|nr:hypothetical protein CYY_008010 [Polysphondylium violaceum]
MNSGVRRIIVQATTHNNNYSSIGNNSKRYFYSSTKRVMAETTAKLDSDKSNFKSLGDKFGKQSDSYRSFRPTYPDELFDVLKDHLDEKRDLALDVGCGNGQAAVKIATFFKKVIATDPSQGQLNNAIPADNIEYRLLPAEDSGLPAQSFDLITVAQAIHWFNLPSFFLETKRLLRDDGVLSFWTYTTMEITNNPLAQKIHRKYYDEDLGDKYWAKERRLVDNSYIDIIPPYENTIRKSLPYHKTMSIGTLLGYYSTWSGYQAYIKVNPDPLPRLKEEFCKAYNTTDLSAEIVETNFPLTIIICKKMLTQVSIDMPCSFMLDFSFPLKNPQGLIDPDMSPICKIGNNPSVTVCSVFQRYVNETNTVVWVTLSLPANTYDQQMDISIYKNDNTTLIKSGHIYYEKNVPMVFTCGLLKSVPTVKTLNGGKVYKYKGSAYYTGTGLYTFIQLESTEKNIVIETISMPSITYVPVILYRDNIIRLDIGIRIQPSIPSFDFILFNQNITLENIFAPEKIEQQVDIKGSFFDSPGYTNFSKVILDVYFEKGLDSPTSLSSMLVHGNNTHFKVADFFSYGYGSFFITVNNGSSRTFGSSEYVPQSVSDKPQSVSFTKYFYQKYNLFDTSFNTNNSYSIDFWNSLMNSAYPFGIVNVLSNGTMVNKISNFYNPSQISISGNIAPPFSSYFQLPINSYENQITDFSILKEFNFTWDGLILRVRLRLTDPIGISRYYFLPTSGRTGARGYRYFSFETLVSGTDKDGVYETTMSLGNQYSMISIIVFNKAQQQRSYPADTLYYKYGFGATSRVLPGVGISIIDVYVKDQEIDVSDKAVKTSVYLKMANSFPQADKSFVLSFLPLKLIQFYSFVNNQGYHQFDIEIPAKVRSGFLQYNIMFNNRNFLDNISIQGLFGVKSQINVTSKEFDYIGPVVESHQPAMTYYTMLYPNYELYLTWVIRFSDLSGFKSANVTFSTDFDRLGYSFNLNSSNLISGDIYDGVYQLRFPLISYCREMNFYISYLSTSDLIGNEWTYFRNTNYTLHPLYKYDTLSYPQPSFKLNCTYSTLDTTPSIQSLLILSPTLDTFSNNRVAKAEFKVVDTGDVGISLRHIPVCYFQTEDIQVVSVDSSIKTIENINSITYECSTTLPYGFGYRSNVLLSIYGISNNYYNLVGYSAIDLQQKFGTFINTTINQPVITSHSEFSYLGGKLVLDGYEFGNNGDNIVTITFINQTVLTPTPSSNSQNQLTIDYIGSTNNSFTIQLVNKNNRKSNLFTINPTRVCISDCGESLGYGYCNSRGGCTCLGDRVGPDCMALIDKPVITPNPNIPSVNVSTGNSSNTETPTFTSFISVVSLRELDLTGTIVNEYIFDNSKWIYYNQDTSSDSGSDSTSPPPMQAHSYLYTVNRPDVNTNITSTIQVFSQSTNITFGHQQLQMYPSSIKFTFNISSYAFSKSTNSLQLVMLATFKSKDTEVCSFTEFAPFSDTDEYLKIQIEDRSLFGRFIKYGIIDGREQVVTNTFLKDLSVSKSDESQSFIGLNIPYYTQHALLDPDFSVLVDQNKAGDKENSICPSQNNGLSRGQIAGIVIGGVVFLFIVSALVVYFLSKRGTSVLAIKLRRVVSKK